MTTNLNEAISWLNLHDGFLQFFDLGARSYTSSASSSILNSGFFHLCVKVRKWDWFAQVATNLIYIHYQVWRKRCYHSNVTTNKHAPKDLVCHAKARLKSILAIVRDQVLEIDGRELHDGRQLCYYQNIMTASSDGSIRPPRSRDSKIVQLFVRTITRWVAHYSVWAWPGDWLEN